MKAIAFSNNDIAVVAWTFGGRLKDYFGFAIYRIDVLAGTETPLPAMATFKGQSADTGRTTVIDPAQKFLWKDVYAGRGNTYHYKVVTMGGTPGNLQPLPYGALPSNQIQLTPHCGALSVYFNREIPATQGTATALHDTAGGGQMVDKLNEQLYTIDDPLRNDMAVDMIEALTTLPKEAARGGATLECAFSELDGPKVIASLKPLQASVELILTNMPGKVNKVATNDVYAGERAEMTGAGAIVTDRFMASNHVGHNKFQVLRQGKEPHAALFGSTNVTEHGLCAQTNNTSIARSSKVAAAYQAYWTRLQQDTLEEGPKVTGPQDEPLRTADTQGPIKVNLEDGSGAIDIRLRGSPRCPSRRLCVTRWQSSTARSFPSPPSPTARLARA